MCRVSKYKLVISIVVLSVLDFEFYHFQGDYRFFPHQKRDVKRPCRWFIWQKDILCVIPQQKTCHNFKKIIFISFLVRGNNASHGSEFRRKDTDTLFLVDRKSYSVINCFLSFSTCVQLNMLISLVI